MFPLIWLFCSLQVIHGSSIPSLALLDGNKIPLVGLGTSQIDEAKFESEIFAALNNGYRYIDTAMVYNNEKLIGKALKRWLTTGGKREEIFITSKLPGFAMRPSDVEKALNLSLQALGVTYLDMYLVHKPCGSKRTSDFHYLKDENGNIVMDKSTDIIAIWKEMEVQVRTGKTKSIGLSNFNETQILRIWENAQIKPTNLQVETNVYIPQKDLRELCEKLGIVMTAYSPLGSGKRHVKRKREIELISPLENPVVTKIAKKHKKSPAQVLLRFNAQRNIVVIPKSANPNRIKENMDIFGFELSEEEISQLATLDQHGKYRKFDFLTAFNGVQYHPEYPFADVLEKLQSNLIKV